MVAEAVLSELNEILALVRIRRRILEEHDRLCREFGVPAVRVGEWPSLLRFLEEHRMLGVEDGKLTHFLRGRKAGEVDPVRVAEVLTDYRKTSSRIYKNETDLAEDYAANYDEVSRMVDRLSVTTEKPRLISPSVREMYREWLGVEL